MSSVSSEVPLDIQLPPEELIEELREAGKSEQVQRIEDVIDAVAILNDYTDSRGISVSEAVDELQSLDLWCRVVERDAVEDLAEDALTCRTAAEFGDLADNSPLTQDQLLARAGEVLHTARADAEVPDIGSADSDHSG